MPRFEHVCDGAHMLFDEDHRNDDDVAGKDGRTAGFEAGWIVVPVGRGMDRERETRQVICEAAARIVDGCDNVIVERHEHHPDRGAVSGRNGLSRHTASPR